MGGPIICDVERLLGQLERLVAEMEERYGHFERARVQDLTEYNHSVALERKLARIVPTSSRIS